MKSIFIGLFTDLNSVFTEFQIGLGDLEGKRVIFASYEYGNYDGDALVVLKDVKNNLFMVKASHCSCYGLEGQWDLEETTKTLLKQYNFYLDTSGLFEGLDEMGKIKKTKKEIEKDKRMAKLLKEKEKLENRLAKINEKLYK